MIAKHPRIVTLTTVYNRRLETLSCIRSLLYSCQIADLNALHVVVDDNSTDGTYEAIRSAFPQVHILKGTGSLYWAGGMRLGFEHIRAHYQYDFLIPYNNDCLFFTDAIQNLLDGFLSPRHHVGLVVSSLIDPISSKLTYGGKMLRWNSNWLPPSCTLVQPLSNSYRQVDTLNMNLCCIRKDLLDQIGFLDHHFLHSGADYDYGLRAKTFGYITLLSPSVAGFCNRNTPHGTSREASISFPTKIRRLFSVKEYPFSQILFYYRSHGGYLWFLWLVLFYLSRLLR